MAKFFSYELFKKKDELTPSFAKEIDNSAETIDAADGGIVSYSFAPESFQDEQKLIKIYRDIAKSPEIGLVINEIRNETFIFDSTLNKAIDIRFFDDSKISDSLKEKISSEFDNIYNLLDFKNQGNKLLESWYIDSKLFLHKIVDINNLSAGIKKVVKVDPLKIKKIKEYPKADKNGIYNINDIKEYYLYSDAFTNQKNEYTTESKGMKIGPEYITYCDSGIYDENRGIVLGHLYKTITPYNNLKLMEESLLIYRVSRSPERRVFYIDVGNLPKNKGEQYLKEMMNKFRNKLTYDSQSGSILDRTNALSMIEDYWIPRRGGTSGTEITTLPSGDNTGIVTDVIYFKEKFLKSLNVPVSRFQDEATSINYGATNSEISRDEYRFKKFIDNLRKQFCFIFEDLLKTQLLLKNIITNDDWDIIKSSFNFVYEEDNNFVESKELEILTKRLSVLDGISSHVGKYYSEHWVMSNILKFSDEQIAKMKEEINSKDGKSKETSDVIQPIDNMQPNFSLDNVPVEEPTQQPEQSADDNSKKIKVL